MTFKVQINEYFMNVINKKMDALVNENKLLL